MLINEKYQFALDGNAFPHDTTRKAVEMDVTLMNTEPGFSRCIRVGTACDKLPEGFVILFSHWSITDVPFTTGTPQVSGFFFFFCENRSLRVTVLKSKQAQTTLHN